MKKRAIAFAAGAALFITSFALLLGGVQGEKLAEKFIDRQTDLRLVVEMTEAIVDGDGGGDAEFYRQSLRYGIEVIDRIPQVFAGLYDSGYSILSTRYADGDTAPFDPFKSDAFRHAVEHNESGALPVVWEDLPGGISRRKMMTCFRWAYAGEGDEPYLLVCAVSKHSIKSPAMDLFIGSVLAVFSAAAVLLLGAVAAMMLRLGRQMRVKK